MALTTTMALGKIGNHAMLLAFAAPETGVGLIAALVPRGSTAEPPARPLS